MTTSVEHSFTNEVGNKISIRIAAQKHSVFIGIKVPNSVAEWTITPLEFEQLRDSILDVEVPSLR